MEDLRRQLDLASLPVQYHSAKLKPHMISWNPCEIEAVSAGTAIEAYYHILKESKLPIILGTDSKPVYDAANLIQKGQFSMSPRITKFLNNINRVDVQVKHVSGKLGHNYIPDYLSRQETPDCTADKCQICNFINQTTDEILDQTARQGAISIETFLQPNSTTPMGNMKTWQNLQLADKACNTAVRLINSGQQPPKKPGPMQNHIRRYVAQGTVTKDGLLVVLGEDTSNAFSSLSAKTRQRIVIPQPILPAVIWQLHEKLDHPPQSQFQAVIDKYYYGYGTAGIISNLYNECSKCASKKQLPRDLLHKTVTEVLHPGIYFHLDVIRRAKQRILAIRDHFSSFTNGQIVPSENETNLRDGLFAIVTPLRQASPITVKTDNAAAFQGLVRKNDPHLQKAEITLVLSEVMNKNSNAVIDKGILELEKELLNLQPDGQPISQTTLSIAINNLNSKRLRRNGKLTASEIHTSRDAWSGANLSLDDNKIFINQNETRSENNK